MLGAGHALLCISLAACLPRAVAVGGSSRGLPLLHLGPFPVGAVGAGTPWPGLGHIRVSSLWAFPIRCSLSTLEVRGYIWQSEINPAW